MVWSGIGLRGKPWSIDEERILRQLVEEGRGIDAISQGMGKTRTAVKGKLNNLGLGLNLKVVATGLQNSVATTTTSLKEGNGNPLVFLKDATVDVQNSV